MHADRFCDKVHKILGDGFTVKWKKKTTDHYGVIVIANHTGQRWEFGMMYDDFRALDPVQVAARAYEALETQMREIVNRTTTRV